MLTIRLDTPALRSLIQQDEEAQIQITQAAVAEICRRTIPKYAGQVADEIIKQELKDWLTTGKNQRGWEVQVLSSQIKDRIKAEAQEVIDAVFRDTVTVAMQQAEERSKQRIEQAVAGMEARIIGAVDKEINKRIDEGVKLRIEAITKGLAS